MKKTILIAAVWMGVSAATFAAADAIHPTTEVRGGKAIDMSVETFKDMKYKLSIKNVSGRSYIAIKKATGEVLYSEYTSKIEEYTKVFDLSNLMDGEYLFVVDTKDGYVEKPFSIKTEITRVVTPISTK
jgi:hypothetical protein